MSDYLYNQIIQRNYSKLLEEVDSMHIVDKLYQENVIDADDMEKITNMRENKCRRDGTKELLKILRQKGPEAVRTFVSVLGEAGYVDLGKQLKKSENSPIPEPMSAVLEKHSNRISQLEQKEAENEAQIEHLKSENSEMKIQLSALGYELNSKKETKNQNEYRSQNQEIRGQKPIILPNPTKIELSPCEGLLIALLMAMFEGWKAYKTLNEYMAFAKGWLKDYGQ